jgi:glutathione S-transferase
VNSIPLLYSFRRCPFAIRARMALACSGTRVELREVKLSNIPESMLQLSAKATVPVLRLRDGRVIDESLDIMNWSLSNADPKNWLDVDDDAKELIRRNDEEFKPLLDRYKYADRHPDKSQHEHRRDAEYFLQHLEQLLSTQTYLSGDRFRLCDAAILPFIRQFAGVEPEWFVRCEYAAVRNWLESVVSSAFFGAVMKKYRFWCPGDEIVFFDSFDKSR